MKTLSTFFFCLLAAVLPDLGCSTQVPPNTVGGSCETNEQCDKNGGLVCRCVRRKNPDEEGSDQILAAGTCQLPTFKCTAPSDGGPSTDTSADTGAGDVAADGAPSDTGGGTDAGSDASDGG